MIRPKSSLPMYLVVSLLIASTAICHLVRAPPGLGGMFIEQLRSSTISRFDSQLSAWAGTAADRRHATRNALRMARMVTWRRGADDRGHLREPGRAAARFSHADHGRRLVRQGG